jgi:DNA-binding CsgD family transcriptional regulator
VPGCVIVLATLALALGDGSTSRDLLEPLVAEMRVLEMHLYTSWGLTVLGAASALMHEDEAARAAFAEAGDVATLLGNDWLAAVAEHNLAELERGGGHLHRAEDLHHQALARRVQRNLLPGVIESVEALAALAVAQESGAEAVRLLAAAAAGSEALGLARWPVHQPAHDRTTARARELLDAESFEKAWAEGASLTIEDAVAYASRARGERKRPTAGWDSLTPTEERVVELVVEGMTNPQIAERLFVTRGTVKVHLGHIFAKLGMSTRAELAAHAARRAAVE